MLGLRYVRRSVVDATAPGIRLTDGNGFPRAGPMDMSRYMEMFMRHREIDRVVEEIPGGVRTTTESKSPDLTAQLQAHVSSMYSHLDQGADVSWHESESADLFRQAGGYRRQLTLTPTGVIAEETADDPALTQRHGTRRHDGTTSLAVAGRGHLARMPWPDGV